MRAARAWRRCPPAIGISSLATWSRRSWSGVRERSRAAAPAIRPISVAAPVAVTTKRPSPRATVVPARTEVRRSAGGVSAVSGGSARLLRGRDSPVSVDSSTCSSVASTSRPSAATRSPALSAMTSPTTTSSAGRSRTWPSRRTRAVGASSARTAAAAWSARPSWIAPNTALAMTIARITPASSSSPIATEIAAAPTSSSTIEFPNWRATSASRDGRGSRRSRLGPSRPSRRAASASPSPAVASTPS
jgi:hypothetical protein